MKPLLLMVFGLMLAIGTTSMVLFKAASVHAERIIAAKKAAIKAKEPDKPWDFWTIELENLSNDLKDERSRLKKREEAIEQREARLAIEIQELESTRKQVEALRSSIEQRLIEVNENEVSNLKKMAQSYLSLSPKAMLAVFREMDDTSLVKLLAVMKSDAVGTVLKEMLRQGETDPLMARRAAVLTDKLRLVKTPKPPPQN